MDGSALPKETAPKAQNPLRRVPVRGEPDPELRGMSGEGEQVNCKDCKFFDQSFDYWCSLGFDAKMRIKANRTCKRFVPANRCNTQNPNRRGNPVISIRIDSKYLALIRRPGFDLRGLVEHVLEWCEQGRMLIKFCESCPNRAVCLQRVLHLEGEQREASE